MTTPTSLQRISYCQLSDSERLNLNKMVLATVLDGRECPCKAGCQLSGPLCCRCADKRPVREGYAVYVDGRGVSATQHRSYYYCPGCRQVPAVEPAEPERRRSLRLRLLSEKKRRVEALEQSFVPAKPARPAKPAKQVLRRSLRIRLRREEKQRLAALDESQGDP